MGTNPKRHTFITIQDIYKENDESGEEDLVKKNVHLEYDCYLTDIVSVKEITNDRGKIVKNRCLIRHIQDGQMVVIGNKKELSELVFNDNTTKPIGHKIGKVNNE